MGDWRSGLSGSTANRLSGAQYVSWRCSLGIFELWKPGRVDLSYCRQYDRSARAVRFRHSLWRVDRDLSRSSALTKHGVSLLDTNSSIPLLVVAPLLRRCNSVELVDHKSISTHLDRRGSRSAMDRSRLRTASLVANCECLGASRNERLDRR